MKPYLAAFAVILFGFASLGAAQQASQTPAAPEHPAANAGSQAPDELVIDGKVMGKKVPARPGDICMLCNRPISMSDPVYLVNGQRVPLHADEAQLATPDQLKGILALLRPRGAFLGAEGGPSELSAGWFYFGLYVLVGLLFAAVCAHRALQTGYNPIQWFLIGLVFTAFGYLALLTRPKREVAAPAGIPPGLGKIAATYKPEPCAKCGFTNHPSATKCLGCGTTLTPKFKSEVARAGLSTN